jgi:cytochrome b561
MRSETYTAAAKAFHWVTAALILLQLLLGWSVPDVPRGAPAPALAMLHMSLGATIIILVAWRIAYRLMRGAPPPVAGLPWWQGAGARIVHLGLYGLILAMAVSGLALANALDWRATLWGLPLPALFAPHSALAKTLSYHGKVADLLLIVIGLHVAAALYHHFIRRDATLRRMLPAARSADLSVR